MARPDRRDVLGAAAAALAAGAWPARAQRPDGPAPWPAGPLRIVVPFPPGGSVDSLARALQPALSARLGVPVVIDNRGGASGALGALAVARAAPDGQTFLFVFDSFALHEALVPNLGFDPGRDLAPVLLLATAPMLVTTPAGRPWRDLAAVAAEARARPEALTYGTIGNGSLAHLTTEWAQGVGGFRLSHVPYRGGGPLAVAALAGEVDLPVATRAALAAPLDAGALRVLAQTGAARSPRFPDAPTLAEAGLPGIAAAAFWGALAPAATPAPVRGAFAAALAATMAEPAVRARLEGALGLEVDGRAGPEFGAFLDGQRATWGRLVRERGIRAD